MTEKEIDIREYLKILLKRRWTIQFLFLVITLGVTGYVFMMTPLYKATAKVLIERRSQSVVDFKDMYNFRDSDTFYQTQHKLLASSNVAKRVVKSLDLRKRKEFAVEGNLSEEEKDFIAGKRLAGGILIEPIKQTYLVNVSYISPNKELTSLIANELVKAYTTEIQETRNAVSQETADFLSKKIDLQREKLEKSEFALQKYKQENSIISYAGGEDSVSSNLKTLNNEVIQAENERVNKEAMLRQMEKLLSNPKLIDTLPMAMSNGFITSLKASESELQQKLSSLSKKFGSKHPNIIQATEELRSIQQKLRTEILKLVDSARSEYELALNKEKTLKDTLSSQKEGSHQFDKKLITYTVLNRDVAINRQLLDMLLTRFKETGINSGLQDVSARVIEEAMPPKAPFKPQKALLIALGAFVGLLIGIIGAFLREYFDNAINTGEDVKRSLGIPFLGPVPLMQASPAKGDAKAARPIQPYEDILVTYNDLRSHASEAFRGLRTSIQYASVAEMQRSIVFTSTLPGEGKTSMIANMAVVMAQGGAKVLLIDTDLRKPRVHKVFGLSKEVGITNFLVEAAPFKDIVQQTKIPNLSVITCGHIPPNPSELLGNARLKELLEALYEKKLYDKILFDSPPIMAVTDPLILSRVADAVVLVTNQSKSTREMTSRAVQKLKDVNAHILGAVLNQVTAKSKAGSGYYYYNDEYSYYYYSDEEKEEGKPAKRKSA